MSYKQTLERIVAYIPTVRQPIDYVDFRSKLKWSASVVLLYLVLTNVPVVGVDPTSGSDFFGQFRSILAGAQGSVLTLGIGPIVTASIVLQLLSGADLLPLNLNDERDQALYQGLKKLLVVVMVFLTSLPIVFAGNFLPPADIGGLSTTVVQLIIFAQIAFGGLLIFYMDQVISKWGVGSGIGLFIVAGVSQRLMGGFFSPGSGFIFNWVDIVTGQVELAFSLRTAQTLFIGTGQLLPLITTVLIFTIVVYAESTRVQIPISNSRVTGAEGQYPIKLIYASVLPLILVRAVQANVQFLGRALNSALGEGMPAWLGVYGSDGQATQGFFYFVSPIQQPTQWMWWLGNTTAEPWEILIRLSVDVTWMVLGGAVFALFWIRTADMDSDAVSEQIYNSGLEIPGFRRSPQQIRRVLDRYIPYITVLGGGLLGLLAVSANLLGTIGGVTGTGLLLTVSITYKLYEEIGKEKAKQMNSMFREFLG